MALSCSTEFTLEFYRVYTQKDFKKKSVTRHFIHLIPGDVGSAPVDVLPELVMGSQPALHGGRSVLDTARMIFCWQCD